MSVGHFDRPQANRSLSVTKRISSAVGQIAESATLAVDSKAKAMKAGSPGGNLLGAIGAGAAKATNPFGINSDLNPASAQGLTNLAGLAGMAPNENAVQFFSNIEFREFTFDFEIFTPSAADKAIAETLVRFFKHVHPWT